ncbi:uncharacterized protein LOC133817617 [Humulus lupulus]|uniref:uncharacterized protein LOC133817617 n=1 Tax=Humulus lupulus TaxID=3486 RepID=UPI002B4125E4|nr:uncharacterized protein LOC133817617 [Humulus lupulus]
MQILKLTSSKPHNYSRLTSFIILSFSICILYFLVCLMLVHTKFVNTYFSSQDVFSQPSTTSLEHIVFGIASNKNTWEKRKDYIKLWWKPERMRGCVFLDEELPPERQQYSKNDNNTSLPPICISGDTSRFRYTYRGGYRSAIRLARVVVETMALNHSGVRWYVFGDDDTVFFPENLVETLSKYDHGLWYYVGTNSEIYEQNIMFGFDMAFGGAGFAISHSLAKVLAKVFDSCIERYPHLYGSDSRIFSCIAELGVGLTREPGFHQMDIRGDVFGLLATHPVTPLVSLHHLDQTDPIFPNMSTPQALQHLFKATEVDSQRLLQQTICYDIWYSWTIVVSWGYAVQIYGRHMFLPDVLHPPETFRRWKIKGNSPLSGLYSFTTRELHPDTCRRPTIFFLDDVSSSGRSGEDIKSTYRQAYVNCSIDAGSPRKLREVRVFSHKLNLDINQLKAPRRHCCDVLPSKSGEAVDVAIRECKQEELINMHP